MADSVGQIGLDLVVNQQGFNKQMQSLGSLAKKAGATLAAAFAVKKLVDFGAQCIELGSDLAEVQNVVDVTFTSMSSKVNEFAKNAATSFGLSETMAKRYTGTFGAMAKAFGFNESAAYDMSTTLTGLAGDVASFYNISQDESYTKLKSVFTGETESLKDLGVVMTQTALDQFALANGYGKVTAKMSEGEKVALRYAFVQQQLATASGDFARTSDGWANQVRILNLQFSSFKATLGQGFINLFSPILKMINAVIGRLQSLANAFLSFTEMITGKKSAVASSVDSGVGSIATEADTAASSLDGVADSAKKAAKAANALSIDELNVVSPEDSSGSSGGSGASAGAGMEGAGLADQMATAMEDASNKSVTALDKIREKLKELSKLFMTGFQTGLGDVDFSKINTSVESIKQSLKDIFTALEIATAADTWINSVVLSLGKITGSAASIGTTAATLLTGAISGYFEQNSDFIKDRIVGMLDASSRASEIWGNFSVAVADIFTVFQGPEAQQIGADLVTIFANSSLSLMDLSAKIGADLLDALTDPIIKNKDKIKTALEGTLEPIQTVTGAISDFVTDTWKKVFDTYDKYVKPAFEDFKSGLDKIVSAVLDAYNTHFLPVFKTLSEKFEKLVQDYIVPLRDAFLELAGKVIAGIAEIWNTTLAPFVAWLMETLGPYVSQVFETVGTVINNLIEVVTTVVTTIFTLLGDLVDFIVAVFTGDWEGAWNAIKKFFQDLWDGIGKIIDEAWEYIKSAISGAIELVRSNIEAKLTVIKEVWSTVWNSIKEFISTIWGHIKDGITEKIDNIKTGLSKALDNIKEKWDTIWTDLKTTVIDIFNGIWSGIKIVINDLLKGIEVMANGVVRGVNKIIGSLNGLTFDVPDWVTALTGMTSFGFNIPTIPEVSIPKLAQGGYVKANTPQLAMIGDNRHQGEVVAPEDKLLEMALKAAELVKGSQGQDNTYILIVIELLNRIIEILDALDLNLELDGKSLVKGIENTKKRLGFEF